MKRELIGSIVREYGTPLYIYDSEKMVSNYNALKSSFPENFEIFYSMKANPLLGVCQLFRKLDSKVEVASKGELVVALKAGFLPRDIVFSGPGKTEKELLYAVETNIYSINIECVEEAVILSNIGKDRNQVINISLRINPDFNSSGALMKMSGLSSQFGIDQSEIEDVIRKIKLLTNINIIGLHVYLGTQILSAQSIASNIKDILDLALSISERFDIKIDFLDLGGGFGVPYFNGQEPLDLSTIKMKVSEIWRDYKDFFHSTRIGIESGRFLVAESGLFVTKILYVKKCKGMKYYICDGGSNFHSSAAFLGRYVRNNFPMYILGKECDRNDHTEVNVVGPLCSPIDVIGQKVNLASAENGDILVIEKSGAYGLSFSPHGFLGHYTPKELIVSEGKVVLLREEGKNEDILKGQLSLF